MRKSKREQYADARRKAAPVQHLDPESMLKLMLDEEDRPPARRTLNPTQAAVIQSKAYINFYKGPAGCAKTSTIVAAVLMRLITEPGSKGLIARQDYNDLKGTTMGAAMRMRDRLPDILLDRDKSSPEVWYIKPIPYQRPDGTWDDRPSELRFMALKEDLGGYDFNVAAIDEADEISIEGFNQVKTRMRTKSAAFYKDLPDKPTEEDPYAKDTEGYYGIYVAFNPPEKLHWLYTECTGLNEKDERVKEVPKNVRLFLPHPRENVANLAAGYYDRLKDTLPPDQIERYVNGEWGSTFPGTPAIKTFKRSVHVRDVLDFEPEATLYRFWDFGYRHPFCLFAQARVSGAVYVLREFTRSETTARMFARLVKAQTTTFFEGARRVIDIGDIAVKQKKDTGSTLAELWAEGIRMTYQPQSIESGLKLMRRKFNDNVDGEPGIQINKRNCQILISALAGGYHMDETGELPKKDGYYDHSVDTLRYGLMGIERPDFLTSEIPESAEYNRSYDEASSIKLPTRRNRLSIPNAIPEGD